MTKRRLVAVGLTSVLALAVTGCGNDDDSATDAAPSTAPATPSAADVASAGENFFALVGAEKFTEACANVDPALLQRINVAGSTCEDELKEVADGVVIESVVTIDTDRIAIEGNRATFPDDAVTGVTTKPGSDVTDGFTAMVYKNGTWYFA